MTDYDVDSLLERACEYLDAQGRTELRAQVKQIREGCALDEIGERAAIRYLLGFLRGKGVRV
jgi:hypothetical protein